MNTRYLDLIDRTLDAYTTADIVRYFADVRRDGLREHGFPRLTANLGILLAHGRRAEHTDLFCAMMDFCCAAVPRVGRAGNEFSVRELVCAIDALRRAEVIPAARLARWTAALRELDPFACYEKIARTPDDRPHNWAVFAALSEWMRGQICAVDTRDFVELQLSTQLCRLDENGMYRDPHEPMVYDLVPRALFSLLLASGYRGRHAAALDDALRRAGRLTLKMQSTTGEIPYGGRSAQFLHNEAILAIVLEYEARRYAAEGDLPLAGRFKQAAALALEHLATGLAQRPIRHVKNRFPTESGYGCEGYAYFDKYMITAGSFLYAAALVCDADIPPHDAAPRIAAARTSPHFHKLFLRAEPYFAELDTHADPHYDASGLGRIHCAGYPSSLCLSLPAAASPRYRVDGDPIPFAICPAVCCGGRWQDGTAAVYAVERLTQGEDRASATLSAAIVERPVRMTVTVTPQGVTLAAEAEGEVALMLPAFAFDGCTAAAIIAGRDRLCVTHAGCSCRYVTDGSLADTGGIARNRNGHYRIFRAVGQGRVTVEVAFAPAQETAEQKENTMPITEVVAALIVREGRFLACRRPAHKARGLLWEFVGGKVEPGETHAEALVRECREELAVTVAPADVYMTVDHVYPDLTVRLTLFRAAITAGEPQLLEHVELRWITPEEIDTLDFCPADVEILEKIKREGLGSR